LDDPGVAAMAALLIRAAAQDAELERETRFELATFSLEG
jgi:hypothetical protein